MAQAVQRHGAQLLLHRAEGVVPAGLRGDAQGERELGREPADGPRQVHVREQLLPAVALHAKEDGVASAPAGQGAAKSAEQDVVDLGAVGRGDLAQQGVGGALVQGDGEGGGGAVGVGAGLSRGQFGRCRAGACPVRQVGVECAGAGVPVEPGGPAAVGRAGGGQFHR